MAYNAARTYLEDVRDYVNLPQHAEYRDDLQFLRMIASSSMEQEALGQFREAADSHRRAYRHGLCVLYRVGRVGVYEHGTSLRAADGA